MKAWSARAALLLLIAQTGTAATFEYTIVYPDDEQKNYLFEEQDAKLKLPGSKWICYVKKLNPEQTGDVVTYSAAMTCFHGNKSDEKVISITSCNSRKGPDATTLGLYKGERGYRIQLSCRP